MKILITQRDERGAADSWIASSEDLPRKGIGRTQAEAMASLLGCNLDVFGIQEIEQDVLSDARDSEGKRIRKTFTWRVKDESCPGRSPT